MKILEVASHEAWTTVDRDEIVEKSLDYGDS
jgi:hypothetical protein